MYSIQTENLLTKYLLAFCKIDVNKNLSFIDDLKFVTHVYAICFVSEILS